MAMADTTSVAGSPAIGSGPGDGTDLVWNAPLAMAAIAHEIRNPLLSVSANMELLRDQLDAHDPRRRCVDRVLCEVDRLAAVVDRLVEFATTRAPRLEPVNLRRFVETAVDASRERLLRQRVQVDTEGIDPAAVARLDPELMGRVISNLIQNAAEAISHAGRLRISGWPMGDGRIVLRFDDTGPGIPPGMAGRIFEPFVTTKPTGTGLGLPFSRRIARAHGGDLRAIEGDGGRMELCLPAADTGDDG